MPECSKIAAWARWGRRFRLPQYGTATHARMLKTIAAWGRKRRRVRDMKADANSIHLETALSPSVLSTRLAPALALLHFWVFPRRDDFL
jgi:hypothetical protein